MHCLTIVTNLIFRWTLPLTLIRAAGGLYDFRNFEEVYLCNGLSFRRFLGQNVRETTRFFAVRGYFVRL
jgi:hypothetical protein